MYTDFQIHCQILKEILYATMMETSTEPELCYYTTLSNLKI